MLESLGVTNANEIALNALREAKAQSILTTYDLAGATIPILSSTLRSLFPKAIGIFQVK